MVDASDQVGLALVSGLQAVEDVKHQSLEQLNNLVVVLLESHLQIETGELGQVAGSVAVLGTEDGADLKDTLEAGGNEHLLVELGRLGKESLGSKVCDLKDVGATFRGSTEELWGLDADETVVAQELGEEVDNTVLDGEDGAVVLASQVNDAVVEAGVQGDVGPASLLLVLGFTLDGDGALGILDLHGQL